MAGSELILLAALLAILVLLKFVPRGKNGSRKVGIKLADSPVRQRPRQTYSPGHE